MLMQELSIVAGALMVAGCADPDTQEEERAAQLLRAARRAPAARRA
jgi:hypothetical protein